MEAALSRPFLESTIMFSSTSKYEQNLKRELWLCHKNMELSMTEILQMPVSDRKAFIYLHNKDVSRMKDNLSKKGSGGR